MNLIKKLAMLVIAGIATVLPGGAFAQDNAPAALVPELAAPVIEKIANGYPAWKNTDFSGKFHMDGLPLSPTVKIYMEHDSLIQISLRAPLVGEVGRLELSNDRLLCVNKMKKVYVDESPKGLFEMYPSAISDFQSILLARVVLLGQGELKAGMENVAEVIVSPDGGWVISEAGRNGAGTGLEYGWLVGVNGRTDAFVGSASNGKYGLDVLYTYEDKGMQMDFNLLAGTSKPILFDIDFNSVKWGGKPMPPIKCDNYRKVGFKEFMSALK